MIRIFLIGLGSLMLVLWVMDLAQPRARYVSGEPEPGATIDAVPRQVTIHLSEPLASGSTIEVIQTVAVSAAGEVSHPGNGVDTLSGLDPDDTREKTLRAVLRDGLAPGIFAVRWRSQAKRGRGERSGMYYFGVQRAPPEEVHGWSGSPVHERDLGPWNRQRLGRNALLASGLILIALAAMVQRRPRSG